MKKMKYLKECKDLRPKTFYYSQYTNKKTPFYNSEEYTVPVGNEKYVSVPPYMENYLIRGAECGKRNLYSSINYWYGNLDMIEKDEFVENFLKDHKSYPIENFPEDIKVYSINGRYSFLDGYGEVFVITEKQEIELNNIIKECGGQRLIGNISNWFYKYYEDRGIAIKSEVAETYAASYLCSKGIKYNMSFTCTAFNALFEMPSSVSSVLLGALIVGIVFLVSHCS